MNVPNLVPAPDLLTVLSDIARELDRLGQRLAELPPPMTEAERRATPRPRTGFPAAARTLAELLRTRPEIGAVCRYDSDAVIERLDRVASVDALIPRLQGLLQRAEDARLGWLADAQQSTFAVYNVARVRAAHDGTLAPLIAPLRKVLARRQTALDTAAPPV